ncbi:hypothetical protein C479_08303 [Halovivax asiaticus JCM 14624]|uniref:Antitoxin n=1 Tax=Halovivax asiaticus JCM 14624 TaxID=1227490 RepID=M0BKG4_9EURY|nr:antitoxin VapB family protein [Halovivax asiaticus]ELZ10798.1 hypothetical protein C479_08303 [Halovivax asiaticus JCM 14624]
MGTKTIGIREDVYDRLRARKREDESFTELVDRLIDETSTDWRETFGRLADEEAAELDAAVRTSREQTGSGYAARQRDAIDSFEAGVDESSEDVDDT